MGGASGTSLVEMELGSYDREMLVAQCYVREHCQRVLRWSLVVAPHPLVKDLARIRGAKCVNHIVTPNV